MKYRHYAPAAPMILFPSESPGFATELVAAVKSALAQGRKVGCIASTETLRELPAGVVSADYGSSKRPSEAAAGLYQALRHFDTHPVDVIFTEGVREEGIGRALMNRLRKAASSVREG
jgi:L-threonylcarbamoyladenylate synthase